MHGLVNGWSSFGGVYSLVTDCCKCLRSQVQIFGGIMPKTCRIIKQVQCLLEYFKCDRQTTQEAASCFRSTYKLLVFPVLKMLHVSWSQYTMIYCSLDFKTSFEWSITAVFPCSKLMEMESFSTFNLTACFQPSPLLLNIFLFNWKVFSIS